MATQRAGALHPAAPIVFQRHRQDWRWLSAARLEARCDSAARALGPLSVGQRIAWWAGLSLDHLALDLAIQRGGAISDPRPPGGGGETAAEGGAAWIRIGCREPAAGRRVWFPSASPAVLPARGSVAFAPPIGSVAVGREIWSAQEHRGRAAALAGKLDWRPGESTRRDVVVLHRPLCEPGARLLGTWALSSGAALLLEPETDLWLSSAVWARPTVLAATREEFAGTASWAASGAGLGRRSRGPLARLRRLVVLDGEAAELPEAWRRLGVAAEGAQ